MILRGTLRDIQIIRDGKVINNIDIYSYLIKGKPLPKIRLLDQDIVHVPPRMSTVPVSGKVLRPGYYEILKNESLKDLFNYTGGNDFRSSGQFFIFRNNSLNNKGYIINNDQISNFRLIQGDSIHVPQEPEFDNFVNVQGNIKNPGKYPFNQNLRMSDLINATMSKNDIDFIQTIDLSNIQIFRKNLNNSKPVKIKTSLKENISLKNGDHVNFFENKILEPIESIIITGEIENPGSYPANNLLTLNDLIDLSGGLTDKALDDGIKIFRDSLKIGWKKNHLYLKLVTVCM